MLVGSIVCTVQVLDVSIDGLAQGEVSPESPSGRGGRLRVDTEGSSDGSDERT